MNTTKHTPGPWRWQGEDYRGGWGWQLLVGPNGEGIVCGEGPDGTPYKHLRGYMAIEPQYCKTGMNADGESAPCVHVREADARLIAAAPDLLAALQMIVDNCRGTVTEQYIANLARTAISKATIT